MKNRRRKLEKNIPIATIAWYGPNDKTATKIVVGIVSADGTKSFGMKKWFSPSGDTDISTDVKIAKEITDFIKSNNVSQTVTMGRTIGCPHEEGFDYAEGQVCPVCPFWANRNRFTGELNEKKN